VLTVDNVIQTWVGDAYVSANNLIMPGKMTISGNTVIKSAIVANNTPGTAGYYLRTSGTGIYWSPVSGASLGAYATWSALTATNTAIRTLVSDRLQVANASSLYATKSAPTTSGVFTHTGRFAISTTTAQTDNIGFVQIENTTAASAINVSYTTKNYSGTSQFMQWENFGLRIGSRIITNSGVGKLYFTYGNDAVVMTMDGTGLAPNATNTYDLGTSSLRWRNIYTNDLHLSNGIGDYTVVEGEEDLFLVNNKSGKTFKFALIEVDPSVVPPKASS
jgi:hypothetical protein